MNRFTGNRNPDPDAYFDVETIISTNIDFAPGQHEIMFAFKSIESTNDHYGSIGLHGYYGERGTFAPVNGWSNDGFAYNNVNERVSEGLMVCANYQGPESSGLTLTFSARVSAAAVGLDNAITVNSQYSDSELVTVSQTVHTPSNIQVVAINDQMIEENTQLELAVVYADLKNTVNGIQVSGDNITAAVEGNKVTITPDENWYGETMVTVTVTVHDMPPPNDKASTSFMLTVNSDGVEPTPPAPPAEPTPEPKSDSGSLGFLSLTMLALLGLRRKTYH